MNFKIFSTPTIFSNKESDPTVQGTKSAAPVWIELSDKTNQFANEEIFEQSIVLDRTPSKSDNQEEKPQLSSRHINQYISTDIEMTDFSATEKASNPSGGHISSQPGDIEMTDFGAKEEASNPVDEHISSQPGDIEMTVFSAKQEASEAFDVQISTQPVDFEVAELETSTSGQLPDIEMSDLSAKEKASNVPDREISNLQFAMEKIQNTIKEIVQLVENCLINKYNKFFLESKNGSNEVVAYQKYVNLSEYALREELLRQYSKDHPYLYMFSSGSKREKILQKNAKELLDALKDIKLSSAGSELGFRLLDMLHLSENERDVYIDSIKHDWFIPGEEPIELDDREEFNRLKLKVLKDEELSSDEQFKLRQLKLKYQNFSDQTIEMLFDNQPNEIEDPEFDELSNLFESSEIPQVSLPVNNVKVPTVFNELSHKGIGPLTDDDLKNIDTCRKTFDTMVKEELITQKEYEARMAALNLIFLRGIPRGYTIAFKYKTMQELSEINAKIESVLSQNSKEYVALDEADEGRLSGMRYSIKEIMDSNLAPVADLNVDALLPTDYVAIDIE